MQHLVFEHQDGTRSAVPVNDMSVVNVKTWTPPVFGEGGVAPNLVEDQSVALKGVVAITLSSDTAGAALLVSELALEPLSDAEAAALEAAAVEGVAPPITAAPWEDI